MSKRLINDLKNISKYECCHAINKILISKGIEPNHSVDKIIQISKGSSRQEIEKNKDEIKNWFYDNLELITTISYADVENISDLPKEDFKIINEFIESETRKIMPDLIEFYWENINKKELQTKTAKENNSIESNIIIQLLKYDMVIKELAENIETYSQQKISALVKRLIDKNVVIKIEKEENIYFSISKEFIRKLNVLIRIKGNPINIDEFEENTYKKYNFKDLNSDFSNYIKDRKNILNYLENIASLYGNIFAYKKRYNLLLNKRENALFNALEDYIEKENIVDTKISNLENDLDKLKKSLIKPVKSNENIIEMPCEPIKPIFSLKKPTEPTYKKPGLFNRKKVTEENNIIKQHYEEELNSYNLQFNKYTESIKQYEDEMKRYENEIQTWKIENERLLEEKYNEDLKNYEVNSQIINNNINNKEKELDNLNNNYLLIIEDELKNANNYCKLKTIEYEINFIKNNIQKNIELLNKLYSYNIVYGKYRNFISISSFIDYLKAGRCSELEGKDGAYNLFEQESRMNIIINKLDVIIDSLKKVKENQYFLYSEILDINNSLENIENQLLLNNMQQAIQIFELAKVIDNTDKIAYNTNVTAFYAKHIEKNTKAIAIMNILDKY